LQEVILCCLSVDPRQRYSSAAQVALLLHHPDQIAITERGRREGTDSFFHVLARRLRVAGMEASARQNAREQLAHAPILAVAVDLEQSTQGLHEAIRRTVTRILEFEPGARLACLTVRKTPRIGMDLNLDKEGRNLHVKGLVELRDWARPLTIAPGRITYHVLEGPEIASAIVDYASVNRVDHVVLGARGSSAMRRYLGSVSAQVVAEAPCSVTVVREPRSGTEQTDATAA
jgi:nucleotide-binding universal stress UspA family protein